MPTIDYAAVATAAKEKARDILRGKKAVQIQQTVKDRSDSFVSAIRQYAFTARKAAKADKEAADVEKKRVENQDAFSQALGSVPGVTEAELALTTAAIEKDRKEAAKDREDEVKARAEALARKQEEEAKVIVEARKALADATADLDKLNKGEIDVDEDEINSLAEVLIEEDRAE